MSVYFDFDEVDAFTVGAVGEPGARVFFLQARRGTTRVTVKCEKQQASAIAEYLRRVLNDLPDAHRASPSPQRWSSPRRSTPRSCSVRWASATTAPPTGCSCNWKRCSSVDEDGDPIEDEDTDRGHAARVPHPRPGRTRSASTPTPSCRPVARRASGARSPINPDGHVCPRMN